MSTLYLIRHGESAWNAEKRLQGQSDPELSAKGREQARVIADIVAGLEFATVVTSDLLRSTQTAEIAGFDGIPQDARWRERGLGEWETRLEADVGAEPLAALSAGEYVPPGGEAWPDFQARVGAAAEELASNGGSALVFTHGGCVRALVAHLTGGDARAVAGPANASLSVFQMSPRRRVMRFNWTPTYGPPKASDPGGNA